MSNLQAFHKWLSAPTQTSGACASLKPRALPFLERLCKLGRFWVIFLLKMSEG